MVKKRGWKSIDRYFDIDGIDTRYANRDAFRNFCLDFGWKEYMVYPEVADFRKLLHGEPGYDEPDRNALLFSRGPDKSLTALGYHSRAFRNWDTVMLSVIIPVSKPVDGVYGWCADHEAVPVICRSGAEFHDYGHGRLVLLMTPEVRERYDAVLSGYEEKGES